MTRLPNFRINGAVATLRSGGVIAYPTEAVWGLGCDPLNSRAFAALLGLKQRALSKGVILIAADISQLQPYLGEMTSEDRARLSMPRANPTTWIVPASRFAPAWITGGRKTLAVRVTSHPLSAALCKAFGGPIVSTSANKQGKPPATTALKVRCYFPGDQVFVVPGALGGATKPSEIRDIKTGEVLRPGV